MDTTSYLYYSISCPDCTKERSLSRHRALRSRRGTGFDYWLGNKGENNELPFQNAVWLEVSGIRRGDESRVNARIKQKLEQVSPTDGILPAYIVVVEFSNPLAFIVKK